MEKNKLLVNKGKELSFLLRHDKESFEKGLIDKQGWRNVSEIIEKYNYTKELMDEILTTNDKKRYEYNSDETKVRARQGHSIEIDIIFGEKTPPDMLYHGTDIKSVESIMENGIEKRSRQFVHLSADAKTARIVGKRHGVPFVLQVNSKKMHEDGYKFYLSNNEVWLTEFVSNEYLSI